MTELEKIEYAKSFIDKLANGINPLDDTPIPEGDIVNHVRLSRCFFYVSDILRQVIENGGTTPTTKSKKQPFTLSDEARANLKASSTPLVMTQIVNHVNMFIDLTTTKKLSASKVTQWLIDVGLLYVDIGIDGKKRRFPTDQGLLMGILSEERQGQYGRYTAVVYNTQAQQFIYDNLDAIMAHQGAGDGVEES